jgi:hypothetical protein
MTRTNKFVFASVPGNNAAQMGTNGVQAKVGNRVRAFNNNVGWIALQPLSQGAFTYIVAGEKLAGDNIVPQ